MTDFIVSDGKEDRLCLRSEEKDRSERAEDVFTLNEMSFEVPDYLRDKGQVMSILNKVRHKALGQKVLLIEDDRYFRARCQALLATLGFSDIETEIDGQAAWSRYANVMYGCMPSNSYDLIVTDYDLPMIDGIEFIRRMIQDFVAHPPCIIMTRHSMFIQPLEALLKKNPKIHAIDKQVFQDAMNDLDDGHEFLGRFYGIIT